MPVVTASALFTVETECLSRGALHPPTQKVEELRVDGLDPGVAGVVGLLHVQVHVDLLRLVAPLALQLFCRHFMFYRSCRDAQQIGGIFQILNSTYKEEEDRLTVFALDGREVFVLYERDISQM